ncbi:MAG: cbb3-type cytochrome oxidase assembly protein CcoS [Steroidobacteraceae bacterium]
MLTGLALLLIPISILLVVVAVIALFWAVDDGQYDNLEEASAVVFEETTAPSASDDSQRLPEPPDAA